MTSAIIKNSVVINLAEVDSSEWSPPSGTEAVALLPQEWCSIGCVYDPEANPRFILPPPPPEEP